MNLTISGHHLEVTPALREYVVNKLERVIRHFDQVVDVNVILSVEKQKEKESFYSFLHWMSHLLLTLPVHTSKLMCEIICGREKERVRGRERERERKRDRER